MSNSSIPIARSLEEGLHYLPDWRHQIAEKVLEEIAKAVDQSLAFSDFLIEETDPFIRQYVRFRLSGRCAATKAFQWVQNTLQHNCDNLVATKIKAMLVAGLNAQRIAREFHTIPFNIATFAKLHFDVSRYLDRRTWLRIIADPEILKPTQSLIEIRERIYLKAAFTDGVAGLKACSSATSSNNLKNIHTNSKSIEAITGTMALRNLQDKEASGIPASPEDLRIFSRVSATQSQRSALSGEDPEREANSRTFMGAMINIVADKLDVDANKAEMQVDDFTVLHIPREWFDENKLPEELQMFKQHPPPPSERRSRFEVERELRRQKEQGFVTPERMKAVFGERLTDDTDSIFD